MDTPAATDLIDGLIASFLSRPGGRQRARASCALAALATAAAVHAGPQPTYFVDAAAARGGNGLSWSSAFDDLQYALAVAGAHPGQSPIIKVAGGLYLPNCARPLSGADCAEPTFRLVNGVGVVGGFAGRGAADPDQRDPSAFATVLSGDLHQDDQGTWNHRNDNTAHVVTVASGATAFLDGVVIERGFAPAGYGTGGGIQTSWNSTLYATDCRVEHNSASDDGGGIGGRGVVKLSRTLLLGNAATSAGGAIRARRVELRSCRLLDNTAAGGGAVAIVPEAGDDASGYGASIVQGSVIAGNSASVDAAAIDARNAPVDIGFSTIMDNRTGGFAAIVAWNADLMIKGCILRGNSNGLTFPIGVMADSTWRRVLIADSIVERGRDGVLARSGVLDYAATNFDADPRFISPGGVDGDRATALDNDYRLGPDSPCVDAVPIGPVSTIGDDADGAARPVQSRCACTPLGDIGAYELPGPPCPAPSVTVRVSPDGRESADGLTWATAVPTIEDAMLRPNVREVWVKGGTYIPKAIDPDSRGGIVVQCALTIRGGFRGNEADHRSARWTPRPRCSPATGSGTTGRMSPRGRTICPTCSRSGGAASSSSGSRCGEGRTERARRPARGC